MPDSSTTITLDTNHVIGEISPLLFGGFAEHIGRCIYGGIYDVGSPLADERGFRRDCVAALKEMGITILRYPGGNFVSGYNWRDGIGPRDQRPRRRELAWQSIETNQFGTDEFIDFCRELRAEPMMTINLGTGTVREAGELVEYCNAPPGTELADLRVKHGHREPHNIRYWGLGNEMDGPWQIGALSADEYARKACEAAKVIKWHDKSNKTIVAGSSGPGMPTFGKWDRTALEHCWAHADYLSLHNYATNWEHDTPSFLGYAVELESQVMALRTVLSEVKQKLGARHDVFLCWDEWNVWYKDRSGHGGWKEAPHLCEEIYNLEDALVNAQWMNVLLRNCDVIRIACIAQIVNVISPLLTTRTELLRQSTFYPFVMFSSRAKGLALAPQVKCAAYSTKRFGDVLILDTSASFDPKSGAAALFLVHRGTTESVSVEVKWEGHAPSRVQNIEQIAGMDPLSANSWARPDVVVPRKPAAPQLADGRLQLKLPPLSLTALSLL
jgi:alpha-L-arabinofuranosidase